MYILEELTSQPGKHTWKKLYVSDPSFVVLGTVEELILGVLR
jgi:hypothetical protein